MARIDGVPAADAGPMLKIIYWFARRAIRRLTGHTAERMIEPVEMYAHVPRLLRGYARLEQVTGALHHLDDHYKALAELKAATVTTCEYCIDLGSEVARRWGLSDEQLLALPGYQTSPLFTAVDKLVLDYAAGMSRTPVDVSDELVTRLREHFSEVQIVELTHLIALENLRGRFNLAMGIGAVGFSDGRVCAIPETQASTGATPRGAAAAPETQGR